MHILSKAPHTIEVSREPLATLHMGRVTCTHSGGRTESTDLEVIHLYQSSVLVIGNGVGVKTIIIPECYGHWSSGLKSIHIS